MFMYYLHHRLFNGDDIERAVMTAYAHVLIFQVDMEKVH